MKASGKIDTTLRMWLGFAAFHLGDYKKAMEVNDSFRFLNMPNMLTDVNNRHIDM